MGARLQLTVSKPSIGFQRTHRFEAADEYLQSPMTPPYPTISKPPVSEMAVRPNLVDYERARESFGWHQVYGGLDWLPGGLLNMAHEAIDRHVANGLGDRTALVWQGRYGERERYTFAQVQESTNRFANVLLSLGIKQGDRVFVLMDRLPELHIALFGSLKAGAVCCSTSSRQSIAEVKDELKNSGTKVLVTQPHLRRAITPLILELFDLEHILVINKNERDPDPLNIADLSYEEEMSKASPTYSTAATNQLDSALIQYVTDAANMTRGVAHRHLAAAGQRAVGRWVLDLHPDDVYWRTPGPGRPSFDVLGLLPPWLNGVASLVCEGPLEAADCYEAIREHRVTVWDPSPETMRALMEAGDDLPGRYDLSTLRHIVSTSGPMPPEAVLWSERLLGMPVHDTWSQSETGGVLIANFPCLDIRPGSIGKPLPGVEVGVLDEELDPVGADTVGRLAVRPGWPSMFSGFWNDPESGNSRYGKGWYVTGERARIDPDGYVWLEGTSHAGA